MLNQLTLLDRLKLGDVSLSRNLLESFDLKKAHSFSWKSILTLLIGIMIPIIFPQLLVIGVLMGGAAYLSNRVDKRQHTSKFRIALSAFIVEQDKETIDLSKTCVYASKKKTNDRYFQRMINKQYNKRYNRR